MVSLRRHFVPNPVLLHSTDSRAMPQVSLSSYQVYMVNLIAYAAGKIEIFEVSTDLPGHAGLPHKMVWFAGGLLAA